MVKYPICTSPGLLCSNGSLRTLNEESDSTAEGNEAEQPDPTGNADKEGEGNDSLSTQDNTGAGDDVDNNMPEQSGVDSDSPQAHAENDTGMVVYDFNHPQHRLRDPDPTLNLYGKKIASEVAGKLDADLHVNANVELINTRYCKRSEFISGLEQSVSAFKSDISPFSRELLVVFERGLILSMVDMFFGGATLTPNKKSTRELSETERRFAQRLRTSITQSLAGICQDCFTITNNNESIISAEELATANFENSVFAVQKYSVKCKENEETFSIVFPWSVVESLVSNSPGYNSDSIRESNIWKSKLKEHLSSCAVELQGKLAETEVTVSQLMEMQKGDFIPLGEVGAATFMVDNTPIFNASIGASNGFVSASILHWSLEGDSAHE